MVVISQPVDDTMRGRGLKNVNEEPHPQVPVMEFTADEELHVKWAEIVRLKNFEAKKDILRQQATGPLLTVTWVPTVQKGSSPQIFKMMPVLAARHGWGS